MRKCVMLSSFSLPYSGIGSWTGMYDYFLERNIDKINYLVCPKPQLPLHFGVSYIFVKKILITGIGRFNFISKYYFYLKAVKSILAKEDEIIVKIVDNTSLLFDLHHYLEKHNLRRKVRILFFMHGYSYFLEPKRSEAFYSAIDHMVYLSESSYAFELSRTHSISSRVSILSNGIDLCRFRQIESSAKSIKKSELLLNERVVFLWCANDRPKKGLHIILEAWRKSTLYRNDNYELLLIGCQTKFIDENINSIGRKRNHELAVYYQISDFYLFSTLCHEGFGLSLAEALSSGLKCLVSDITPLRDIFTKYGSIHFVRNPNMVESWIEILENAKNGNFTFQPFESLLFKSEISIDTWSSRLVDIIDSELV